MSPRDPLRCNGRIASSILDALANVGDAAGHARVRKVFEDARVNPRAAAVWVPVETLDRAFRTLGADRNFARRVGAGLVSNQRMGFVLFTEGVATLEKALRRCDSLFAREEADGVFHALQVGEGRARIAYRAGKRDAASADADDAEHAENAEQMNSWSESFCGVRQGMLEALPLGFGLLPARVRETECVGKGGRQCCYEVEFGARSLRATMAGTALAALLGISGVVAWHWLGGLSLPAAGALTLLATLAGGALGHCVDLARQLEVVAGARRGHLALLEQADHALAEKMDELAKLNAHEQSAGGSNTDRLRALLEAREATDAGEETGEAPVSEAGRDGDVLREVATRTVDELYDALGPLQRSVERVHRLVREKREAFDDGGEAAFDALRGVAEESRRLSAAGVTLGSALRAEDDPRPPVDIAGVVQRAVDAVRPLLGEQQRVDVELADSLPQVACEPFQMEQVIDHLIRNAIEASDADGRVVVRASRVPDGLELDVEDAGPGIPEEALDQIFDPFALEGKTAGERGLGLAICYRIVTQHGGELRVSTDAGEGTRMTVVLRSDAAATGESPAD